VYAQRADESRALVADLQAALTWAADQPDLVGMVEVIDDYRRGACPSDLLNEIMAALKSGHGSPGAVDRLRHMLEQVPQLTWPALLICPLLQAEERFDEAIAILDEAWANGLAPSGRIACRLTRAQAGRGRVQSYQEQKQRIHDDVSDLQSRAEGSAGRAGEAQLAEEYATLRSAFEAAASAARAAAQQALTDAEWVLKHTQEEEDRKAARDLRKQLKKFLKESAE